MKKIMTFAIVAGSALALAACSGETAKAPEEAPVEEAAVEAPAEEMAPAGEAVDEAEAAAAGLDPTGNPIGPAEVAE